MLQVYTGDGKGKTTAALGVAFRAAGYKLKTMMFSFLKDDPAYGEAKAVSYLPGFILRQVGRDAFVNFKNPAAEDLQLCRSGWEEVKLAISQNQADIFILDELNIVLATSMLPTDEVVEFLQQHKNDAEIIVTGRYAPEEIIKIADLVTEMREVKHYFHKGVSSRNGIDH